MKNVKKILGVFILAIVFGLCIPTDVVRAEEVMSEEFKSYLNENLEFEINTSEPKDILDFLIKIVVSCYENNIDYEKINFDFEEEMPDDFHEIILIVNYQEENEERHKAKIKYVYDKTVEEKINEIISDTKKEIFNLYDLETIDFYYNRHKMPANYYGDVPMLNLVSGEAKSILDNKNIKFKMLANELQREDGFRNSIFISKFKC